MESMHFWLDELLEKQHFKVQRNITTESDEVATKKWGDGIEISQDK